MKKTALLLTVAAVAFTLDNTSLPKISDTIRTSLDGKVDTPGLYNPPAAARAYEIPSPPQQDTILYKGTLGEKLWKQKGMPKGYVVVER